MSSPGRALPITVIGGYLGSGKTTLINRLLERADGRRLGIVVNDFGELGIDAQLIRESVSADPEPSPQKTPVISLANGCVCCTLGDDLRATLADLAETRPRLDQIVIEASGVADPAATAAWGSVPGFAPGGVIVLAAADSVMNDARDRYVGSEVIRQIERADLVILTKCDRRTPDEVDRVAAWIGMHVHAPVLRAVHGEVDGDVDVDVVLGRRAGEALGHGPGSHAVGAGGYVSWSTRTDVVDAVELEMFLRALPDGVLRLKGFLDVCDQDGFVATRLVQVVGRNATIVASESSEPHGVEVIGVADVLDLAVLDALAAAHLTPIS